MDDKIKTIYEAIINKTVLAFDYMTADMALSFDRRGRPLEIKDIKGTKYVYMEMMEGQTIDQAVKSFRIDGLYKLREADVSGGLIK